MNLLSTNKRVDSMYINPNIFGEIFQEYSDKVNQKKAERIPYDSWRILHRLDMDWPKETGSNDICFHSRMSVASANKYDDLVTIDISYIYGTTAMTEVEIPEEFLQFY